MNLYEALTSKQKRSIKRDLDSIFSSKGVTFPKSIEDLRELGWLSPYIKVEGKQVYFSAGSIVALRRICGFIEQTEIFQSKVDYSDVYRAVVSEIERWFNEFLVPDVLEFAEPLEEKLSCKIKTYRFICRVEGISLNGVDRLTISAKTIEKYDSNMVAGLTFPSDDLLTAINDEYGQSYVIVGEETGSRSVAQEKFYYNAELSLSVIRMYACILLGRAIYRTHVRLVNDCFGAYDLASSIGWVMSNKEPIYTRYIKQESDIVIDEKTLIYLRDKCYYDELSQLIEKDVKSELEELIVKAIYWFGEAQKDKTVTSKLIKLWSCIECFFSKEQENITESNAQGVASLLVYGGYVFEQFDDYSGLKKKIKKFYALRSKALHRAEYRHIDKLILEEFSYIVAWVIIIMTSISLRGYKELSQIQAQVERLDRVSEIKK